MTRIEEKPVTSSEEDSTQPGPGASATALATGMGIRAGSGVFGIPLGTICGGKTPEARFSYHGILSLMVE